MNVNVNVKNSDVTTTFVCRMTCSAKMVLVLSLATVGQSLRIRLPFFGRKDQGVSDSRPPLRKVVDVRPPDTTPCDPTAEKRRRAEAAQQAAEAASSEALRLAAEAVALKAQLAEMRSAASAAVALDSSSSSSSVAGSSSSSARSSTTSMSTSMNSANSASSTNSASGSSSASASSSSSSSVAEADAVASAPAPADAAAEADADAGPQAVALATAVRQLEELLEAGDGVELTTEQTTEMMMEEASARVVWSELGLGPQEAFPFEPLAPETIDGVCERVFGLNSFAVRQVECTPCGTLFRGSLRQTDPSKVNALVQRRLAEEPDLASQLRLFMLQDPIPADRTVGWDDDPFADPFSDELPFEVPPEPVFLALPMGTRVFSGASESPIATIALPLASQVLGLVVCVGWAAYAYMDTPVLLSNGEVELERVLPIVGATLALQALHEGAHLAAAMRHRLELSLPFVIPSSMLGSGGGHMPLADFPQNRTQLYDFALAGPLTGGVASGALFLLGLGLTSSASPEAAALFPQLPTTTLHASLLASLAVEMSLGLPFGAETVGSCALHPFALAGLGGLFANALAMLPVGRLDGGRAAIAAYGRRTGATLGALALLLLALACALSKSPAVLLVWSALAVGLFRQAEVLCVDEVSEIDTTRSNALLPLLVLAALFLIPLPGGDDASAAFGELARVTAGDSQLW